MLDASGLSFDHAVSADPLSMERIEVLRGPGALQYAGSAVGGVVNVIDCRIPREAVFDAQGGTSGKLDLGLASGNAERGTGVVLEGGNQRYAWHTEFEGTEVGTVFNNRGTEWRLEARHVPLGALDGLLGLQVEQASFSADGDEAFAPYSQTRQRAWFVHEELSTSWGRLSAGARAESVKVNSAGHPSIVRFVPASRQYRPGSVALGALWNVAPHWQLSANLARTERAPKDYELYADGPHLATHAYEVGDASFGKERSTNLDVGLNFKQGAKRFGLSAFVNRFRHYLSQQATGLNRDLAGNGAQGLGVSDCGDGSSVESGCSAEILPEYRYTAVAARFTGLEAKGSVRLIDQAQTLDLEWRADRVRARNTDTGEALPRIAPERLGATLLWARGPWSARLGASHSAAQTRLPLNQLPTEAHTLWNAWLGYRTGSGDAKWLWYARIDNLSDRLAYSASSILTQTAPGKAPLPGRSLKLGLQAGF